MTESETDTDMEIAQSGYLKNHGTDQAARKIEREEKYLQIVKKDHLSKRIDQNQEQNAKVIYPQDPTLPPSSYRLQYSYNSNPIYEDTTERLLESSRRRIDGFGVSSANHLNFDIGTTDRSIDPITTRSKSKYRLEIEKLQQRIDEFEKDQKAQHSDQALKNSNDAFQANIKHQEFTPGPDFRSRSLN